MRCKACDSIMEEWEIYWNESANQMEDLCSKCRASIIADETTMADEYTYELLDT